MQTVATNKRAHEKLLNEMKLQFGRMNSELSQVRSEREALRIQLQQFAPQQTAEQTAQIDNWPIFKRRLHPWTLHWHRQDERPKKRRSEVADGTGVPRMTSATGKSCRASGHVALSIFPKRNKVRWSCTFQPSFNTIYLYTNGEVKCRVISQLVTLMDGLNPMVPTELYY
jgi:hypothetical protein